MPKKGSHNFSTLPYRVIPENRFCSTIHAIFFKPLSHKKRFATHFNPCIKDKNIRAITPTNCKFLYQLIKLTIFYSLEFSKKTFELTLNPVCKLSHTEQYHQQAKLCVTYYGRYCIILDLFDHQVRDEPTFDTF